MTISKKTLDEAIILVRKYRCDTTKNGLCDEDIFDAICAKCRDLCKQINCKFLPSDIYDLFWLYCKANATTETIYKAIELLGIEIE